MIDGVTHKVQNHTAHTSLIEFAHSIPTTDFEQEFGALFSCQWRKLVQAVFNQWHHVGVINLECDGTRVVPTHLQEIRQHGFEALNLGEEQFNRASVLWAKALALRVQYVSGEPDRGQRCAKLMGHIGNKALLHLRKIRQTHDLTFHARCHSIERAG